jgi:hypothetical protein
MDFGPTCRALSPIAFNELLRLHMLRLEAFNEDEMATGIP